LSLIRFSSTIFFQCCKCIYIYFSGYLYFHERSSIPTYTNCIYSVLRQISMEIERSRDDNLFCSYWRFDYQEICMRFGSGSA